MPVIASQRVLFLLIGRLPKPGPVIENEKGNWSGTTVRSVPMSFSSPKLEREGFFNFIAFTCVPSAHFSVLLKNAKGCRLEPKSVLDREPHPFLRRGGQNG